jgi:YbbR domain-containing protein
MPEKLKRLFLNNWGLKASALLMAVLVWAIISGRERTFSEKTLKIPIEVFNVSENVEVVNLRPEEVRISLKGSATLISEITPENLLIRIDLKNINESSKLNYFAEDYLEMPAGVQLMAIHPKMIEVFVEEFASKEVPIKIRFRGQLRKPLQLKEAKVVPDRVTIISYKSQINDIDVVLTEEVNLNEIEQSLKRKITLKQTRNILKFTDHRDVDLILEIENTTPNKK